MEEIIATLTFVRNNVHWDDVLDWFNNNDIDYTHMTDLDMYIQYLKSNEIDFNE